MAAVLKQLTPSHSSEAVLPPASPNLPQSNVIPGSGSTSSLAKPSPLFPTQPSSSSAGGRAAGDSDTATHLLSHPYPTGSTQVADEPHVLERKVLSPEVSLDKEARVGEEGESSVQDEEELAFTPNSQNRLSSTLPSLPPSATRGVWLSKKGEGLGAFTKEKKRYFTLLYGADSRMLKFVYFEDVHHGAPKGRKGFIPLTPASAISVHGCVILIVRLALFNKKKVQREREREYIYIYIYIVEMWVSIKKRRLNFMSNITSKRNKSFFVSVSSSLWGSIRSHLPMLIRTTLAACGSSPPTLLERPFCGLACLPTPYPLRSLRPRLA